MVTTPALDPATLAQLPGIDELKVQGTSARFRTTDATATLAALTQLLQSQRADLIDLQVRKSSLEDVFLRLTDTGDSTGRTI